MTAVGVVIELDPQRVLESILERTVIPRADCVLWANAVDRGYGRVNIAGQNYRVHRLVWELAHGPIPDGLTIDHLCRVRSCLNVEHMELVTAEENARRAIPFRPLAYRRRKLRTHCKRGHEFTPENTRTLNDGSRRCRICTDAYESSRDRRSRKTAS